MTKAEGPGGYNASTAQRLIESAFSTPQSRTIKPAGITVTDAIQNRAALNRARAGLLQAARFQPELSPSEQPYILTPNQITLLYLAIASQVVFNRIFRKM